MNLLLEFNTDAWDGFHAGDFNGSDGFYIFFKEWIERKCTYRRECKEVLMEIPNCNPFETHEVYGRALNWRDAAINCLTDYLEENDNTWYQIDEYVIEEFGSWDEFYRQQDGGE